LLAEKNQAITELEALEKQEAELKKEVDAVEANLINDPEDALNNANMALVSKQLPDKIAELDKKIAQLKSHISDLNKQMNAVASGYAADPENRDILARPRPQPTRVSTTHTGCKDGM